MSRRKQKKYEKELRAQRAAQEKIDAEDARKAEREEKARARKQAEEERRAALTPEERKKEDKRNTIIGLIGVAVLVMVLFVACGGGDDDTDPTPAADDTTPAAPAAEEAGTSDEERAAGYESWLKEQMGVEETFTEILMRDASLWGGYVNGFDANRDRMHVRLQIDRTDPDAKEMGERAAGAIANLVRMSDDPRVENVDWVVIDDGAGTYIAQESV